jgi:NAD(P)-dependent dehydrogenase (short-subunit alcohol dehydrogenase family)
MSEAAVSFEGRVAIVTGAGGGMGRAYALELSRRGAKVLVNDYGGDVRGAGVGASGPAERVAAEIRAAGGQAQADHHAVGDGPAARAIAQAAYQAFGRIDILVNNAGVALPGAFTDFDDERLERHYATNLIGAHHLMRAVWPGMLGQAYGRILNVSSNGALGIGGNAPYAAAKAGLIGLTLDAALEGRAAGVLVNAVMPTAYSRMIEEIPDPATVAWFAKNLPPEAVAAAMAWFLSDECDVTGKILLTGGGRLSSLIFAETGELVDRELGPETVRSRFAEVLSETVLTPTPSQAAAGARYMRHFPWEGEEAPDFGPDAMRVTKS